MRQKLQRLLLAICVLAILPSTHVVAQYTNQQTDRWQKQRDQKWPWPSEKFNAAPEQRDQAGVFDYYALVLSWSPTYCADAGSGAESQCNRRDGRRYSFILHGLWPQYVSGWPSDCRLPRRPFVPQPTIDRMQDIMPSQGLVIHEYKKHGTCSGLDPDGYYDLARRLYQSVRMPREFVNPFETQYFAPDDVVGLFVSANPALRSDMIAVACGGAGNRLREVRICFSKDGKPQSCGPNENKRKLCASNRLLVQPVRSTIRDDGAYVQQPPTSNSQRNPTLPRPRVIESLR